MRYLLLFLLIACHDDKPVITPNPPAANCLIERDERQAECFHLYKLETERDVCLKRVREACDCTTPEGVSKCIGGGK